jgi:hypothetical protein
LVDAASNASDVDPTSSEVLLVSALLHATIEASAHDTIAIRVNEMDMVLRLQPGRGARDVPRAFVVHRCK